MARLPLFWAAYRHMSTDGPPVATSGTLYPGVAIGRPANGRYQPMMRLAAAHSFVHGKASLRPPSKGTAIGTVPGSCFFSAYSSMISTACSTVMAIFGGMQKKRSLASCATE